MRAWVREHKNNIILVVMFAVIILGSALHFWEGLGLNENKQIIITVMAKRYGIYYSIENVTDLDYLDEFLLDNLDIDFYETRRGAFIEKIEGISARVSEGEHWDVYADGHLVGLAADKIRLVSGMKYSIMLMRE